MHNTRGFSSGVFVVGCIQLFYMANRRLARSVVLQTLFEWDLSSLPSQTLLEALHRNMEEFGDGEADVEFSESLITGISAKKEDIDLVITKAAPEWPLEKIAPIDRNILRIGLFELLFSDRSQVPPKVAINESIELAKLFGGDSSSRFINGVLGAVYKELGEPDKGTEAPQKPDPKDIPLEKLSGAIVYADHEGEQYVALVHDVFGHWTVSKGHVEDPETGVRTVLENELGIQGEVEKLMGENEYIASHPEKGKIRKHVYFFLVKASYAPLRLKKGGGLDDAKWFRVRDVYKLNFYEDVLPIINASLEHIQAKQDA